MMRTRQRKRNAAKAFPDHDVGFTLRHNMTKAPKRENAYGKDAFYYGEPKIKRRQLFITSSRQRPSSRCKVSKNKQKTCKDKDKEVSLTERCNGNSSVGSNRVVLICSTDSNSIKIEDKELDQKIGQEIVIVVKHTKGSDCELMNSNTKSKQKMTTEIELSDEIDVDKIDLNNKQSKEHTELAKPPSGGKKLLYLEKICSSLYDKNALLGKEKMSSVNDKMDSSDLNGQQLLLGNNNETVPSALDKDKNDPLANGIIESLRSNNEGEISNEEGGYTQHDTQTDGYHPSELVNKQLFFNKFGLVTKDSINVKTEDETQNKLHRSPGGKLRRLKSHKFISMSRKNLKSIPAKVLSPKTVVVNARQNLHDLPSDLFIVYESLCRNKMPIIKMEKVKGDSMSFQRDQSTDINSDAFLHCDETLSEEEDSNDAFEHRLVKTIEPSASAVRSISFDTGDDSQEDHSIDLDKTGQSNNRTNQQKRMIPGLDRTLHKVSAYSKPKIFQETDFAFEGSLAYAEKCLLEGNLSELELASKLEIKDTEDCIMSLKSESENLQSSVNKDCQLKVLQNDCSRPDDDSKCNSVGHVDKIKTLTNFKKAEEFSDDEILPQIDGTHDEVESSTSASSGVSGSDKSGASGEVTKQVHLAWINQEPDETTKPEFLKVPKQPASDSAEKEIDLNTITNSIKDEKPTCVKPDLDPETVPESQSETAHPDAPVCKVTRCMIVDVESLMGKQSLLNKKKYVSILKSNTSHQNLALPKTEPNSETKQPTSTSPNQKSDVSKPGTASANVNQMQTENPCLEPTLTPLARSKMLKILQEPPVEVSSKEREEQDVDKQTGIAQKVQKQFEDIIMGKKNVEEHADYPYVEMMKHMANLAKPWPLYHSDFDMEPVENVQGEQNSYSYPNEELQEEENSVDYSQVVKSELDSETFVNTNVESIETTYRIINNETSEEITSFVKVEKPEDIQSCVDKENCHTETSDVNGNASPDKDDTNNDLACQDELLKEVINSLDQYDSKSEQKQDVFASDKIELANIKTEPVDVSEDVQGSDVTLPVWESQDKPENMCTCYLEQCICHVYPKELTSAGRMPLSKLTSIKTEDGVEFNVMDIFGDATDQCETDEENSDAAYHLQTANFGFEIQGDHSEQEMDIIDETPLKLENLEIYNDFDVPVGKDVVIVNPADLQRHIKKMGVLAKVATFQDFLNIMHDSDSRPDDRCSIETTAGPPGIASQSPSVRKVMQVMKAMYKKPSAKRPYEFMNDPHIPVECRVPHMCQVCNVNDHSYYPHSRKKKLSIGCCMHNYKPCDHFGVDKKYRSVVIKPPTPPAEPASKRKLPSILQRRKK